jgi:Mg-chelatase subunit ChlD
VRRLALLPVIGAMGAAVDYSFANNERTALQKALDSTALALAKMMPANQATLDQRGREFLLANLGRTSLKSVQLSVVPTVGHLKLDASGTYVPGLVNVLGVTKVPVSAHAEVKWGFKKLELALALDNTGSMAWHGKIVELKRAVKDLLEKLKAAARKPEDVRVAIVPFDTTVRLNVDYKSPPAWVEFDGKKEKNTWIGCVEDRDQPNDVRDTAPDLGASDTLYPATACSSNGALVQMLPLTNDWLRLRLTVEAMNPNGNTNVTIGLVWAWHALTPTQVLPEGSPPNKDLEKAIILLTDGENTENRWTTSRFAIDARVRAVCTNIKATGIKVYTVRVIDGNASLLRECASEPGMYFDVQDAGQLSAVFSAIGDALVNLHLAK